MSHCTIIGMVVAKPEKREELHKILAAQVVPTRAEPGCINYDFHADNGAVAHGFDPLLNSKDAICAPG